MKSSILSTLAAKTVVITMLCLVGQSASAAEKALLDILLGNGVITQAQYDSLMKKESLTSTDILGTPEAAAQVEQAVDEKVEKAVAEAVDKRLDASIGEKIAKKIDEDFPVKASYGKKGFRLESKDGNWQTNLQWRAQLRYTNPFSGDPRQLASFD